MVRVRVRVRVRVEGRVRVRVRVRVRRAELDQRVIAQLVACAPVSPLCLPYMSLYLPISRHQRVIPQLVAGAHQRGHALGLFAHLVRGRGRAAQG